MINLSQNKNLCIKLVGYCDYTEMHGEKTPKKHRQKTQQYKDRFCKAGCENRRWMQVAELIGLVSDGRVLLAAPERQENQGKRKVNYILSEY